MSKPRIQLGLTDKSANALRSRGKKPHRFSSEFMAIVDKHCTDRDEAIRTAGVTKLAKQYFLFAKENLELEQREAKIRTWMLSCEWVIEQNADCLSIRLKGPINSGSAEYVGEQVIANRGVRHIRLEIDSPGGSLDETKLLVDILKRSGAEIVTLANGECSSAATILFACGKTRLATPHTRFMVHRCQSLKPNTTVEDFRRTENWDQWIADRLAMVTHTSAPAIRSLMETGDYNFSANQAKNEGLVTDIYDIEAEARKAAEQQQQLEKQESLASEREARLGNRAAAALDNMERDQIQQLQKHRSQLLYRHSQEAAKFGTQREPDATPTSGWHDVWSEEHQRWILKCFNPPMPRSQRQKDKDDEAELHRLRQLEKGQKALLDSEAFVASQSAEYQQRWRKIFNEVR